MQVQISTTGPKAQQELQVEREKDKEDSFSTWNSPLSEWPFLQPQVQLFNLLVKGEQSLLKFKTYCF